MSPNVPEDFGMDTTEKMEADVVLACDHIVHSDIIFNHVTEIVHIGWSGELRPAVGGGGKCYSSRAVNGPS